MSRETSNTFLISNRCCSTTLPAPLYEWGWDGCRAVFRGLFFRGEGEEGGSVHSTSFEEGRLRAWPTFPTPHSLLILLPCANTTSPHLLMQQRSRWDAPYSHRESMLDEETGSCHSLQCWISLTFHGPYKDVHTAWTSKKLDQRFMQCRFMSNWASPRSHLFDCNDSIFGSVRWLHPEKMRRRRQFLSINFLKHLLSRGALFLLLLIRKHPPTTCSALIVFGYDDLRSLRKVALPPSTFKTNFPAVGAK